MRSIDYETGPDGIARSWSVAIPRDWRCARQGTVERRLARGTDSGGRDELDNPMLLNGSNDLKRKHGAYETGCDFGRFSPSVIPVDREVRGTRRQATCPEGSPRGRGPRREMGRFRATEAYAKMEDVVRPDAIAESPCAQTVRVDRVVRSLYWDWRAC